MCTNFHFENEETKAQSNAPKETADLKPRGPWSWRFLGSQAGRWGVIGGVVLGVSTTCDSRLCPDLRTQSVQGPPSSVLEAQPAGSLHRGPPSTAPDDTRPSHPSRNMSSLFSRDTKSLVRELGRKDELVPVTSLASALRLRLFCLVRKKHRHHLCPWDTLIATDFSLMDALEPGSPIPEVSRSEPIHIQETVAAAMMGAMSMGTSGLLGNVTGGGVATRSSALAVQTLRVSPSTWETLVETRKLRTPRPWFLKDLLSQKRESLYVVTEAVEVMEATTLQSLSGAEGAGQLSFLGLGLLKLRGQGTVAKEKMVTIPQGTVLAYRVLQLVMEDDRWAVRHLPESKPCRDTNRSLTVRSLEEKPDFRDLQMWAGAQLRNLATLPLELRLPLLGALRELLQDPRALQELEDMVEQALDTGVLGQLDGPGGLVLSALRDPSGSLSPLKGRAVLCLLGALVALGDTQHCLLVQYLEKGILPQQLELVASILEPNFNCTEETTVFLPPQVLSSLQSEDAVLTRSLVESCGLQLGGPGHQLAWDPDVVPQLSALYVSLAGLQLLAYPGPAALQASA
uniref:Gasdermin-A-like n=1 Tax=Sus scrofa TaxID=9823 RepID=A0A8D1CQM9_PIG